jgi:hypothetical protein
MNPTLNRGIIRNGRVELKTPIDLPDGTSIVVLPEDDENSPMSPEEIARVLAAMKRLLPLEIPDDVAADLDAWERRLDQYGIDHSESGIEDVFR